MADSVYRVTEVIGVSTESWEAAARSAVETAAKSVRDLRIAEVVRQDVTIGDGGVVNFRVRLAISFKFESSASSYRASRTWSRASAPAGALGRCRGGPPTGAGPSPTGGGRRAVGLAHVRLELAAVLAAGVAGAAVDAAPVPGQPAPGIGVDVLAEAQVEHLPRRSQSWVSASGRAPQNSQRKTGSTGTAMPRPRPAAAARRPAARTVRAATRQAKRVASITRSRVGEVGDPEPRAAPAGEEAAAERVARADRVDHLDARRGHLGVAVGGQHAGAARAAREQHAAGPRRAPPAPPRARACRGRGTRGRRRTPSPRGSAPSAARAARDSRRGPRRQRPAVEVEHHERVARDSLDDRLERRAIGSYTSPSVPAWNISMPSGRRPARPRW